ncbi:hypothetical protein [Mycolicibacterium gadium]|uniref:Uncharacterized protein n=1 Tax=Mycolicibacterium gadium TaxID=1794 RepID=A0A7I7WXC8_MYCGU|nr:hypothetical protein [Mycolicibacterium gadium]MDG5485415.1 hypothetical protein [Mycolicibacterium gadium]BBZ21495.1 hypothetical protein MGAD_58300 [Mycolicibacterium gadium]
MSKHRTPSRRSPLTRTFGAGIVTSGLALGAIGLLAPATASADVSVGGQSDSPGAAGGTMGGSTASNNTFTSGVGSITTVNQTNGNYTGGDGNTSVHIPVTVGGPNIPSFRWGGQRNSPGAAGGTMGGSSGSGNTVNFRGSFTQVIQSNRNFQGGTGNTSVHIPIKLGLP